MKVYVHMRYRRYKDGSYGDGEVVEVYADKNMVASLVRNSNARSMYFLHKVVPKTVKTESPIQ